MKKLLMIPDINNLAESVELAKKYSLGFEYNDFFKPEVLDSREELQRIYDCYGSHTLPEYSTLHGAFYDVIPFSRDARIREIACLRIEQSIEAAKKMGASAVVFHTNYQPFLNSPDYVKSWVEENALFWGIMLEKHPNISIYLENMFDTSPDILERLSEKLCAYDNYGVCLDYAHAALSNVNPKEWAKRLGRFVKHVHINDNDLVSDLHLAWGDGKIQRENFYMSYDKYLKGTSVLIETSLAENLNRSMEVLVKEGFYKI